METENKSITRKTFRFIKEAVCLHHHIKLSIKFLMSLLGFHILLMFYILNSLVITCSVRNPLIPRTIGGIIVRIFSRFYDFILTIFDPQKEETISRIDLIALAIGNMRAKKTRSIITISGMSIGIGAIVFLVSLGYGVEKLVTARVARLDEMSQADIAPQTGGKVAITDKTIASFKDLSNVKMVLPQIAIVSRVNYNNSVSDMAVYGVTADYLKQSAVKPTKGKIFESNNISVDTSKKDTKETQSMLTNPETGKEIGEVQFTTNSTAWKRVRAEPKADALIIGYLPPTTQTSGTQVWGETYTSSDKSNLSEDQTYGKWITGKFTIWDKKSCEITNDDCKDGSYLRQVEPVKGFISQNETQVASLTKEEPSDLAQNIPDTQVLGDTTEASTSSQADLTASTSATLLDDLTNIDVTQAQEKVTTIPMPKEASHQAVVNTAMLRVLGLSENDALGKTFNTSFVIVGSLLDKKDEKVESEPTQYSIIGVIPDDKTPYFYIPFIDLRSLGITTYSQIKVVTKSQTSLPQVRQQIESLGYTTHSVADTVAQINSIFGTARVLLSLLGLVALSIASLGMFNTLTVSLLERTREVGLMKAMGMKSTEVRELFLTESMIMGIFGGLFGLMTGFVMGKSLGLILSIFSVSKGAGFVDISYIPSFFISIIVVLSLLVGIITGLYPARRATKISALNALRYE